MISCGDIIYTPFKKDSSYFYEQEFRFVTQTLNNESEEIKDFKLHKLDLNSLNYEIYLHPKMTKFNRYWIKKILIKFGIQPETIVESELMLMKK